MGLESDPDLGHDWSIPDKDIALARDSSTEQSLSAQKKEGTQ